MAAAKHKQHRPAFPSKTSLPSTSMALPTSKALSNSLALSTSEALSSSALSSSISPTTSLLAHNIPLGPPGISTSASPSIASSGRAVRSPQHFEDQLPAPPAPIPIFPPGSQPIRKVILHVNDFFRSAVNGFHVLREYFHRPSYDPDFQTRLEDLANFQHKSLIDPPPPTSSPPPPWPFENMSKYLLMNWFHSGGDLKSEGEVNRLVKEVITASDFRPEDLGDFSVHKANIALDKARVENAHQDTPFSFEGWQEVSVDLEIPVPQKYALPKTFQVPGLFRRSLVDVIKEAWRSSLAAQFHLTPFKRIHINPATREETRIYDKVYTSDVTTNL